MTTHVITAGPSAGKTSVVRELSDRGHRIIELMPVDERADRIEDLAIWDLRRFTDRNSFIDRPHTLLCMADTTQVSNKDDFVQAIVTRDDLDLTDDGAEELWKIWTERYENGADEDVLVALPSWFAQDEFGRNRPYFFAQIEHDDPDSGAILFSDARQIDINVIENGIWDQVTMTKALDVLDVSPENDYIDEAGKVWTPRSLMHIFERTEPVETKEFESGGIAGMGADAYDT